MFMPISPLSNRDGRLLPPSRAFDVGRRQRRDVPQMRKLLLDHHCPAAAKACSTAAAALAAFGPVRVAHARGPIATVSSNAFEQVIHFGSFLRFAQS
ncbi:hypothetical protein [Neotabrizicola sp. VNH66]|jgi:hypothetical protein|uniref:hypothetical protein n=1 Tax=Neotabrizicola sp. VNH66 TaxID=3400918 RepID=UPI003C0B09CA